MTVQRQEIDWVARAVGGDPEAFAELCRTYYSALRSFVAARLVHAHLVDDVVQEAFLRVHRELPKHDVTTPFWAFLQEFARRIVHEHLRAEKRAGRGKSDPVLEYLARRREEVLASKKDQGLDRRLGALGTCLDTLPLKERDLLNSVYEGDQPLDMLAKRMERTREALSAHLYRLRQALRNCVERRLRVEVP